jgi:hypothetical protein
MQIVCTKSSWSQAILCITVSFDPIMPFRPFEDAIIHDALFILFMYKSPLILLESAKALHGRNTPLHSGKYINLFTHYRPLGDPEWYTRDNPEHTPEPLLDVGDCRLTGKINEYSNGAVTCDNNAIGQHLSPKMLTATSGEDLFQWWKSVGPVEEDINLVEVEGSEGEL